MSAEALSIALYHSRARGVAKVVMIGIADEESGEVARPSVATLARYAHLTPEMVRRAVAHLEALGEVHRGAAGEDWGADETGPSPLRFLLACPLECDGSTRHALTRDPVERARWLATLGPAR